jgi:hypothetical protein
LLRPVRRLLKRRLLDAKPGGVVLLGHLGSRHRELLKPRGSIDRRGAWQQVLRGLPDDELAARGRKNRHQADFDLIGSYFVPGNPHAVACSQVGRAIVLRELLWRKGVFSVRRLAVSAGFAVVISVHDKLPFDRNGLVGCIVEVHPAAEPARGLFVR